MIGKRSCRTVIFNYHVASAANDVVPFRKRMLFKDLFPYGMIHIIYNYCFANIHNELNRNQ